VTDREQIQDLVHRYCDAVVHHDRDLWASCWAEDSWWELGPGRSLSGRDAIVEHWQQSMDRIEVVVQMAGNGTAKVDGDVGTGRWYLNEHVRRRNGELGMLLAYYDDTYLRDGDGWLFTSRKLTPIYHGPPDLSAPFVPPPRDC
jgi:ketosteroid isomerase-like protein